MNSGDHKFEFYLDETIFITCSKSERIWFFLIPCDDVFVPLHDDRTVFDNTAYNTYSTVCRLLNQR